MRTGAALALAAVLASAFPAGAAAQYFGRNKVNYDDFDFRILRTEHFDIYYYEAEARQAITDFGRMAERWYERLARTFQHAFDERKPIVVYRNQPDFQQTNTISGFISQATGGVTESLKDRVILPFAESYAETDHVLGHELVHAFQYDIAKARSGGGATAIGRLPLWFVEGMAEYLSLGRESAHTAMWMRDAVARDDLPGVEDLSDPGEYFPYRFGHAFWAYVGGVWGDEVVGLLYRAAAERGLGGGIALVLNEEADSVAAGWHRATRAQFGPLLQGRTPPEKTGDVLIGPGEGGGTNLSPVLSPDGRRLMILSQQDPFSIDLYLADARTGEIEGRLTTANRDPHFEALAFVNTSGAWSPDGRSFAFVTYDEGENEIAIADVEDRSVTRALRVPGIGAVFGLDWSPDGSRIVFSGSRGGVTDLFLLDVESGAIEALTEDRYAEWQPAWSPDGYRIVFATDRGAGTDLEVLAFAETGIGILDVRTGQMEVRRFFDAKHVDPAFSPDGESVYFVSDPDGFADVYRGDLDGGSVSRLTTVTTGVSGLTAMAPALSVAPASGRLAFTVFSDGDYLVIARDAAGASVSAASPRTAADGIGALLPPLPQPAVSWVDAYLADPVTGLPVDPAWEDEEYETDMQLDYIAQPTVGVAVDRFGTTLGGSVAAFFSDMLGDKRFGVGVSANGRAQDLGVEAVYLDQGNRFNWGVRGGRVPYRAASASVTPAVVGGRPAQVVDLFVNTTTSNRAALLLEYPLSQNHRVEAILGGTYIASERHVVREVIVEGAAVDRSEIDLEDPPSTSFANASLAYVQDNSVFGFTSPVAGGRSRLEVGANTGALDFYTALADARRYVFFEPLTLAFRALHFGRYGADAESERLTPLYLGQGMFVRGYSIDSFDGDECTAVAGDGGACPEFERLVGSRIAVASAELRIPLFGTEQFGLIDLGFLPIEVSLFGDAGLAWTSTETPSFDVARRTTERVPVFSAGVSARFNILGRLVLGIYWARPFQRPDAGGQLGFQIAPGW